MKKVIGKVSEKLKSLMTITLLCSTFNSWGQFSFSKSLSESDGKRFATVMQNLNIHINGYELESAEKDLRDLFDYTETLNKKKDKDKIECLAAIHCAMSFTVNSLKSMSSGMDFSEVISAGEQCLVKHRNTFRQTDDFFLAADLEYNILMLLPRLYKLQAQSQNDIKFYQLALSKLDAAEKIVYIRPSWKSFMSEIWNVKAGILRDMGRDLEGNSYDTKTVAMYDSLGMSNAQDTVYYFSSSLALLRNQYKSVSISDRLKHILRLKSLLRKHEQDIGHKEIWLGVDLLTKEAELFSLIGDYKRSELSYQEAFQLFEGVRQPENHPLYQLLKGNQTDLFVKMHEWNKVIDIAEKDTLISKLGGLNSDLLRAYIQVGDTTKAKNLVEKYLTHFIDGFNKLQNLTGVERDIYLGKQSVYFSSIYPFFFWQRGNQEECGKLFDIYSRYKGLALASRTQNPEQLKIAFKKTSDLIGKKLKNDELYLDLAYIDPQEEERRFFYVGTGLQYQNTDSNNYYPVITYIVPFSNAYYSPNLFPDDTMLKLNGHELYKMNSDSLKQIIQTISRGEKLVITLNRKNTDGKPVIVELVKDSIFKWELAFREIFACFSISSTKGMATQFLEGFPIRQAVNKEYKRALKENDKIALSLTNYLPIDTNLLSGKKRLFVSVDGMLNKINLETTTIKGSNDSLYFLGDLYDVTLLGSSWDLVSESRRFNKNSITLFGYPDYTLTKNEQLAIFKDIVGDSTLLTNTRGYGGITGNYVFKSLPATKHEVEEIGANLDKKGWVVQIYTGNRALEEEIKSIRSPRILHIATHGFFAQDLQTDKQTKFMGMSSRDALENPLLRSGLAFAGAETTRTDTTHARVAGMDDGILTAEEAQYLHLDSTELVVLSACETGLGEIVNGEGVYGLQRAFRAAGAKSILMSLWKVDDLATETLMKNFYKHWLDDGLSKHDALWQAKLDLRNDKAHPEWAKPYYWGAFVLIGQ